MDFAQPFKFAFEDPDWLKKLALNGLILLIPIVGGIYVLGWALEIARRVIFHEPTLLPDINFGAHFMRGLKGAVIGFVYSLPIIILSGIQSALSVLVQNGSNDSQSAVFGIAAVSICLSIFVFILSLALYYFLPAALGNFLVKQESISAGFQFGEVFALLKTAPVAFLIALVGAFLASMIGSLGVIACIIGVLFTEVYASTITAHFFGQAYNQAVAAKTAS